MELANTLRLNTLNLIASLKILNIIQVKGNIELKNALGFFKNRKISN